MERPVQRVKRLPKGRRVRESIRGPRTGYTLADGRRLRTEMYCLVTGLNGEHRPVIHRIWGDEIRPRGARRICHSDCGLWEAPAFPDRLLKMRTRIAVRFARPCERCFPEMREEKEA